MDAMHILKPDQYFLSEGFVFLPQTTQEAQSLGINIQNRRGLHLLLDRRAYNSERPSKYDPSYHRSWITSRLLLHNQVGINSEMGSRIADQNNIIASGSKYLEKLVHNAMAHTSFEWKDGIPKKPFAFGTVRFNRTANHPWIQRTILAQWNHVEYCRCIARLNEYGIGVSCFGYGWPSGSLAAEKIPQIMRKSIISLNFANSRGQNQIKARTFEVPGAGGFLLTEYAPGLEKFYSIGKEIDVFSRTE